MEIRKHSARPPGNKPSPIRSARSPTRLTVWLWNLRRPNAGLMKLANEPKRLLAVAPKKKRLASAQRKRPSLNGKKKKPPANVRKKRCGGKPRRRRRADGLRRRPRGEELKSWPASVPKKRLSVSA